MGKSLHPAAVHFPIAFLTLGFALDFIYQAGDRVPAKVLDHLPSSTELTKASYYLIGLGLAASIPAILTGVVENVKIIGKQGLFEKEGGGIKEKFKASIAHAVVIDISLAIAGYAWYTRHQAIQTSLLAKAGITSYAPETWAVGAEVAAMALLFFGSNIGGTLTYVYGMGLSVGNSAKTAKTKKSQ